MIELHSKFKWAGPYHLGQGRLHYGWHMTLQYYNCWLKHYTCRQNPASKILNNIFPITCTKSVEFSKNAYPILVEGPILTDGPTTVLDPIWTSAPNIALSWTTAPNSTRAEESITAELWYVPPPFRHLRNPLSTLPPRLVSNLLQLQKEKKHKKYHQQLNYIEYNQKVTIFGNKTWFKTLNIASSSKGNICHIFLWDISTNTWCAQQLDELNATHRTRVLKGPISSQWDSPVTWRRSNIDGLSCLIGANA